MKEILNGYFIDKEGNVYSNRKFKEITKLNLYIDNCGYLRVKLAMKTYKVHRLVAEAFIPNCDNSRNCVNHKDGNKTNNNVDNLEWVTHSENKQHAYTTGITKGYIGRKKSSNVKYGEEWFILNSSGKSLREIARQYGVTHHSVKRNIEKFIETREV